MGGVFMIYYVAVQEENGNYLALNIKKSGFFDQPCTYKGHCQCTLGEINEYTTRYQDESFFRNCLVSEEILTEKNKKQPLAILEVDPEKKDGANWRVLGELLYKDSREYIQDFSLAKAYFREILPLLSVDLKVSKRVQEATKLLIPMFEAHESQEVLAYHLARSISRINEVRISGGKSRQRTKEEKPIVFDSTNN